MRPTCRPLLAVTLLLLPLAGCDPPNHPGPQIQEPPPGFTLNPETHLDRLVFPDGEVVHHDAWVAAGWGNFSGIYINGFSGTRGPADATAARDRAMGAPTDRPDQVREVGAMERLTIDDRAAFGWSEALRSQARGLEYVAYRAVVPYDTVTYTVEFISGDPTFKNRPDSVRAVVASFAIGRTKFNLPLILVGAGLTVFLLSQLRGRSVERARRHASINLPKIPKKDAEGTPGAPAAASPKPSGAPGQSATAPPGAPSASLADAIARRREGSGPEESG